MSGDDQKSGSARREPRRKGKVSEAWLERAAIHYLGRYAATEERLRDVLSRKVRRRNEEGVPPSEEQQGWIDAVVAKCVGYGYVDDTTYATQRTQSLLRKGKPPRTILQDLRHKGVSAETAAGVLEDAEERADESLVLQAAAAFVKRRRFGVFRRPGKDADDQRQKELASLMRAGFPYGIAQEVLQMEEDALMALLP
ncbi:regulatory protein RecX [Kordiimonas marina]|uniref:regulatory protein RecX n=1 Tax=Kordiimonas marina TaxID=2872312 RepID=UPI001FF62061|nr:regulatory protein RecX [Kordiimonas marina]MCJ9430201.1 recombination regulator RecX [Kordiimonas marina]